MKTRRLVQEILRNCHFQRKGCANIKKDANSMPPVPLLPLPSTPFAMQAALPRPPTQAATSEILTTKIVPRRTCLSKFLIALHHWTIALVSSAVKSILDARHIPLMK